MPRTIDEVREHRRQVEAELVKATREHRSTHAVVTEYLRACEDEAAVALNRAEYLTACEIEEVRS